MENLSGDHKIVEGSLGGVTFALFYCKYMCQYHGMTAQLGCAMKILCTFEFGPWKRPCFRGEAWQFLPSRKISPPPLSRPELLTSPKGHMNNPICLDSLISNCHYHVDCNQNLLINYQKSIQFRSVIDRIILCVSVIAGLLIWYK